MYDCMTELFYFFLPLFQTMFNVVVFFHFFFIFVICFIICRFLLLNEQIVTFFLYTSSSNKFIHSDCMTAYTENDLDLHQKHSVLAS